jgi:hypothetical protein
MYARGWGYVGFVGFAGFEAVEGRFGRELEDLVRHPPVYD